MIERTLRANLLALAEAYTCATGVKPSRIGVSAVNDSMFLMRIRRGDNFTVKTADRVIQWFSSRWPAGLPWPEGLERPEPEAIAVAS